MWKWNWYTRCAMLFKIFYSSAQDAKFKEWCRESQIMRYRRTYVLFKWRKNVTMLYSTAGPSLKPKYPIGNSMRCDFYFISGYFIYISFLFEIICDKKLQSKNYNKKIIGFLCPTSCCFLISVFFFYFFFGIIICNGYRSYFFLRSQWWFLSATGVFFHAFGHVFFSYIFKWVFF